MDTAKRKDSPENDWSPEVRLVRASLHVCNLTPLLQKFEEARGPMMTVNFVLLHSPVLSPHDPETVIVSREHQFIRDFSFDNHSLPRIRSAQCQSVLSRDPLEL